MVKKSLLGIVALSAALLGGMMVVPTYATTAEVGNEADLKDCLAASKVCKMTGDINLTDGITVAGDAKSTLDLNGYTISYAPEIAGVSFALDNSGDLTIMDSSIDGNGKITFNAANPDTGAVPGYASNTIRNNGDLTVNSGTIENLTEGGSAAYAIDTNYYDATYTPSITINGGKITSLKPAIRLFLHADDAKSAAYNLTVNGGEITGSYGIRVQLPNGAEGGIKYANVNIAGGTITATGGSYLAFYSYTSGESCDGINLNISGGVFNGYVGVGGGDGTGAETVKISGGTFDSTVYSYDADHKISLTGGTYAGGIEDDSYIATGYKATEKDDKYTVVLNAPVVDDVMNGVGEKKDVNESILNQAGAGLVEEIVAGLGTDNEVQNGGIVELADGTKLEVSDADSLKTALGDGSEIKLELSANPIGTDQETADLIKETLPEGAKKFAEMGIEVVLTAGDQSVGKLTEFAESLQLKLTVANPEELAEGYTRTWNVLRLHLNTKAGKYETTIIPAVYNSATKAIEFETDQLSVYVPYYVDTKIAVTEPTTPADPEKPEETPEVPETPEMPEETPETPEIPESPKTGVFGGEATSAQQNMTTIVLFVAVISAVVLLGYAAKKTKR